MKLTFFDVSVPNLQIKIYAKNGTVHVKCNNYRNKVFVFFFLEVVIMI